MIHEGETRTCNHTLDGLLKMLQGDARGQVPGSNQRGLVADVGNVRPWPAAELSVPAVPCRLGQSQRLPENPGVSVASFFAMSSLSKLVAIGLR